MKILIKLKKSISILTAFCLLISFVIGPTAANAMTNEQATKEYKQIFKDFMLPYSYGQITSAHFAGTDRVIINIQDLHCHPKVQKNIANIIETFDKSYGVKKVYLEGAYGQVSTKWLTENMDKTETMELLDKMIETGRLTGAEYYSAVSGKTDIINGLEEKGPYLDNLKRFGDIIENQKQINLILNAIDEEVYKVKEKYYTKRQYKIEELSQKYKAGEISPQKYYALLLKHVDRLGIDLSKYENTYAYIMLLDLQKNLNYNAITTELQNLVLLLNESLSYNAYQMLVDSTDNFSKLDKLYGYIIKISRNLNLDLSVNFAELDKYFRYIEMSQKINPLDLISEEEKLTQEININFSETKAQREVVFLSNFNKYLRDYVTSKITSDDYKYYKNNIETYKSLWNKYVDNRVLSLLDDYLVEADKFYDINNDRNIYFTNNMFHKDYKLNTIEGKEEGRDDINKIIANMNEMKEVDIVITGGFHSQTVTEILKDQGVNYIVITPNVTDGVKLAEETYYQIAKEQSQIGFQTIANLIASLSPQSRQMIFDLLNNKDLSLEIKDGMSTEEQLAVLIKKLQYARMLDSDFVGNIEQNVADVLKDIVDEEHKDQITPELVDKMRAKSTDNLEELKKILEMLSMNSALDQSLFTVKDLISKAQEMITSIAMQEAKEKETREELMKKVKSFPEFKSLSEKFRNILRSKENGRFAPILDRLEQIEQQGLENISNDTLREYIKLQEQLWNITQGDFRKEVEKLTELLKKNTDIAFATVGYSSISEETRFAETSMSIISALLNLGVGRFGKTRVALLTSPTADNRSMDATTTILSQAFDTLVVYFTALSYIKYVDPNNFTQEADLTKLKQYIDGFEDKETFLKEVDIEQFMDAMKFVADTGDFYSELVSMFKNVTVVVGGRDVSCYKDVPNAVSHNNVVLLTRSKDLRNRTKVVSYKNGLIIVDNSTEYIYLINEMRKKGAITADGQLIDAAFDKLNEEEKNLYRKLIEKRIREQIDQTIVSPYLKQHPELKKQKAAMIDGIYKSLFEDTNALDEFYNIKEDISLPEILTLENISVTGEQIKKLFDQSELVIGELNNDDKRLVSSLASLPKDNIVSLDRYNADRIDTSKAVIVFAEINDKIDGAKITKSELARNNAIMENFAEAFFNFLDRIKYFAPVLGYKDLKVTNDGNSAEVVSSSQIRKVIPIKYAVQKGIVIEEIDEKTGRSYYRISPTYNKNGIYTKRMAFGDVTKFDRVNTDEVICDPILVMYGDGDIGYVSESAFVANYGEEYLEPVKNEVLPFDVTKKGGKQVSAFILPEGTRVQTPDGIITIGKNDVVIKNGEIEGDVYITTIEDFLKNYSETDNSQLGTYNKAFYDTLKTKNSGDKLETNFVNRIANGIANRLGLGVVGRGVIGSVLAGIAEFVPMMALSSETFVRLHYNKEIRDVVDVSKDSRVRTARILKGIFYVTSIASIALMILTPVGWVLPTTFAILSGILPHQLYDLSIDRKIAQALNEGDLQRTDQLQDSKLYMREESYEEGEKVRDSVLKQLLGSEEAINSLLDEFVQTGKNISVKNWDDFVNFCMTKINDETYVRNEERVRKNANYDVDDSLYDYVNRKVEINNPYSDPTDAELKEYRESYFRVDFEFNDFPVSKLMMKLFYERCKQNINSFSSFYDVASKTSKSEEALQELFIDSEMDFSNDYINEQMSNFTADEKFVICLILFNPKADYPTYFKSTDSKISPSDFLKYLSQDRKKAIIEFLQNENIEKLKHGRKIAKNNSLYKALFEEASVQTIENIETESQLMSYFISLADMLKKGGKSIVEEQMSALKTKYGIETVINNNSLRIIISETNSEESKYIDISDEGITYKYIGRDLQERQYEIYSNFYNNHTGKSDWGYINDRYQNPGIYSKFYNNRLWNEFGLIDTIDSSWIMEEEILPLFKVLNLSSDRKSDYSKKDRDWAKKYFEASDSEQEEILKEKRLEYGINLSERDANITREEQLFLYFSYLQKLLENGEDLFLEKEIDFIRTLCDIYKIEVLDNTIDIHLDDDEHYGKHIIVSEKDISFEHHYLGTDEYGDLEPQTDKCVLYNSEKGMLKNAESNNIMNKEVVPNLLSNSKLFQSNQQTKLMLSGIGTVSNRIANILGLGVVGRGVIGSVLAGIAEFVPMMALSAETFVRLHYNKEIRDVVDVSKDSRVRTTRILKGIFYVTSIASIALMILTPVGWALPVVLSVLSGILPHQLYDLSVDRKIAQALNEENIQRAEQLNKEKLRLTDEDKDAVLQEIRRDHAMFDNAFKGANATIKKILENPNCEELQILQNLFPNLRITVTKEGIVVHAYKGNTYIIKETEVEHKGYYPVDSLNIYEGKEQEQLLTVLLTMKELSDGIGNKSSQIQNNAENQFSLVNAVVALEANLNNPDVRSFKEKYNFYVRKSFNVDEVLRMQIDDRCEIIISDKGKVKIRLNDYEYVDINTRRLSAEEIRFLQDLIILGNIIEGKSSQKNSGRNILDVARKNVAEIDASVGKQIFSTNDSEKVIKNKEVALVLMEIVKKLKAGDKEAALDFLKKANEIFGVSFRNTYSNTLSLSTNEIDSSNRSISYSVTLDSIEENHNDTRQNPYDDNSYTRSLFNYKEFGDSNKEKRFFESSTFFDMFSNINRDVLEALMKEMGIERPILEEKKKQAEEKEKEEVKQRDIHQTLEDIRKNGFDIENDEDENNDFISRNRIPVISKPNQIKAFVPDFSNEQQLEAYGFEKVGNDWYAKNRKYYPKPLSKDSIILVHSQDSVGFCSQDEFSRLYVKTADYNAGNYSQFDKTSLVTGEIIDATKMASASVCMVPAGTVISTPEGKVTVKEGEIVLYNEAHNGMPADAYAMTIETFLSRYMVDLYSPTSAEWFSILKEYVSHKTTQYYDKLVERFYTDLSRDHDYYAFFVSGADLKSKFKKADELLRTKYDKYLSKIDVSNFDSGLEMAEAIIEEAQKDPSFRETDVMLIIIASMIILMPKTNPHQHFKTAVSEEFIRDLMQRKFNNKIITQEEVDKIEDALKRTHEGFPTLADFNEAYGVIGNLIRTKEDYQAVVKFMIEDAIRKGQNVVEIRTACDSMVKDVSIPRKNWQYYTAEEGMAIVLDAILETIANIEKINEQKRKEGKTDFIRIPKVSCVDLASRTIWDKKKGTNDLTGGQIDTQIDTLLKFASDPQYREKYKGIGFGFDIAGSEDVGLPPRVFSRIYKKIQNHNKKANVTKIGTTIHASETPVYDRATYDKDAKKYTGGKTGADSAREAAESLPDLERAGHGTQIVLSVETIDAIKGKNITIEICPTCNIVSIPVNFQAIVDSGIRKLAKEHPVEALLRAGIHCVIATDNALMCGTDINKEYIKLIMTGHDAMMNWNTMKEIARDGIRTAFISEEDKEELLVDFEEKVRKIETLLTKYNIYANALGIQAETTKTTAQVQEIAERAFSEYTETTGEISKQGNITEVVQETTIKATSPTSSAVASVAKNAAVSIVTSSQEFKTLMEQGINLDSDIIVLDGASSRELGKYRRQGLNVFSTRIIRGNRVKGDSINIGDYNGHTVRVYFDKKTSSITFQIKGLTEDEIDNVDKNELMEQLRKTLQDGNQSDAFKGVNKIVYVGNNADIINASITEIKNAHTDSISNPMSNKYRLAGDITRKTCADVAGKTGITTFVITEEQAANNAKQIKGLEGDYRFLVAATSLQSLMDQITAKDRTQNEFVLDLSNEENMTPEQAEDILKKIQQTKLSLKKGLDITISVKFPAGVTKKLNDSLSDSIYVKYGVIPVVSATEALLIKGKKEVDGLGQISQEQVERLKGNEIVGFVIDEEAVNKFNDGLLDNIKTVLETLKKINEETPERKYKKGLNAAMSTKFDYTVNDIMLALDILSVDVNADNLQEVINALNLSIFSNDARNYIEYQKSKNNYAEVLGFIRGAVMNTLAKDIAGIVTIDGEKFQRDIKTDEAQAILILTAQAMMQGKTLDSLYRTIEGSDELSARDYLESIRSKLNSKLEEILKGNEYKISKPAPGTLVDFKGIPELLMDDFKKEMSVGDDIKISALAVRSMLAAA